VSPKMAARLPFSMLVLVTADPPHDDQERGTEGDENE